MMQLTITVEVPEDLATTAEAFADHVFNMGLVDSATERDPDPTVVIAEHLTALLTNCHDERVITQAVDQARAEAVANLRGSGAPTR